MRAARGMVAHAGIAKIGDIGGTNVPSLIP